MYWLVLSHHFLNYLLLTLQGLGTGEGPVARVCLLQVWGQGLQGAGSGVIKL